MSDEVNLEAYQTNGYSAPDRCEMCNVPLPDEAARKQHMDETYHRSCPLCKGYVPVAGYYGHCLKAHYNEFWNDHQVAYTDNHDEGNAQPWAKAKKP